MSRRSLSDSLSHDSVAAQMREKAHARRSRLAIRTDLGGVPPPRDHNRPLRQLAIVHVPIAELKPAKRRARLASRAQTDRMKLSLERFDFVLPIVINADNEIIAGHAVWAAARELGRATIPCTSIDGILPGEQEALAIALNRLGETGEWDLGALKLTIQDQIDLGEDVVCLGFDPAAIDLLLQEEDEADGDSDRLPPLERVAVSEPGYVWRCGPHLVGCGDARDMDFVLCLFDGHQVRLFFIDSPYNVAIGGNVTSQAHREFAMASGEMAEPVFRAFQLAWLLVAFKLLVPGGYLLSCMDWRHIAGHILAGEAAGLDLANLIVWSKSNPGQGSLWRSAHELIAAFRKPGGESINNIRLGAGGRFRSNVWTYPGGASLHSDIREALGGHPTPKSLAMVMDAILDVTRHGDLVGDTFLGSGTTLLAAEKTGRRFCGLEIDPLYVDLAIRRWQEATGEAAVLVATGETFAVVEARRAAASPGEEGGAPGGTAAARPPRSGPPKPRLRVAALSSREG